MKIPIVSCMKKLFILCCMSFAILSMLHAQNGESFEEYKARKLKEFSDYKDRKNSEFEEYRRKRNEEFAEYVRKSWQQFSPQPIISRPDDNPIPPIVMPKDEEPPIVKPRPVVIDEVITSPVPQSQPEPIDPIEEQPIQSMPMVDFVFFGTYEKVRVDMSNVFKLGSVDENAVADAWLVLSESDYTNLIYDCLDIRKRHNLCDWAYLMMLCCMADKVFGEGTNEATLLTAYVYCQSGYKMRLGCADGRLYMLYASEHTIYNTPYYSISGENYYLFGKDAGRINICTQTYPQERSMSLFISKEQIFAQNQTKHVRRKSERYADVDVVVSVNQNLLDFYSTYPTSMIDDNPVSRWAMYANTPLSYEVKEQLYPKLVNVINGLDQLDAVNKLLNWVQTAFVYEYDNKVWGRDRAFFAEESLYYPYCDCEDRSILFSKLVRDLLGLNVILVFYPNHLATAVCFTESVSGDYILLNGNKYIVCDPTYIGVPVGLTMPDMDNSIAKVILLE